MSWVSRGDGALGAVAAGKLVHGLVEVLAQLQAARVEGQVIGAGLGALLVVNRVVERVVAVGAVHLALGMHIPASGEGVFILQVHARIVQALPGDDLPGGEGAPLIFRRAGGGDKGLSALVHQAMALPAVGVGGVLDGDEFLAQLAIFFEGISIPGVAILPLGDNTTAQQGGGIGPAELARLQGAEARLVVGGRGVAQEAVHLDHAEFLPVPVDQLAGLRVDEVGFGIAGGNRKLGEQLPIPAVLGGSAANMAGAIEHDPGGGAQVDELIFRAGKIAISEGIPLAEIAGAAIPGLQAIYLPGGGEIFQAGIGVKAVPGDEVRVVTLTAGLHGGDGGAGFEHIQASLIQEHEGGVEGGDLLQRGF